MDERRAQLVKLGIDLFASHAYDEVSIDELARAAGISKGLLYHYFPTKRDFYIATVREASSNLVDLTATPDDMPPLARARAGLDVYLDYVAAHGPAYAALMRGGVGSDPEVARIVGETRDLMCQRLLVGLPVCRVDPAPSQRAPWVDWVLRGDESRVDRTGEVARDAIRDVMIEVLTATVPIAVRVEQSHGGLR